MAGLSAQLVAHLPGHRQGPGPSRFVAVFAVRFEQQESANFSALCAETEMPGATTLRSELRAGEALMSWVSMFVIDPQTTRDQAPAQLWRVQRILLPGANVKDQASQAGITFRRFGEHDIEAAHKLSMAVRWPHRADDWKFIQRLGAGYVAQAGETLVGTALCWSHGPEFASIGMVIVGADYQGRGLGRELMSLAIRELGKRNINLYATPAGISLYQKLGFEENHQIHQHQGSVFAPKLMSLQPGERIRPLGSRDGAKLAALGTRASGMPRATVMAALMEVAEAVVIDRYDEVIACAMLRRFGHGYVIGPVIAPDIERAKALICHWAGTYAGAFIRIDVGAGSGLSAWLDEIGLVQVDTVVGMVRGEAPLPEKNLRQYAVISQALG
jgi:ribosomal protein S18 acetylase RimI-like enzyme